MIVGFTGLKGSGKSSAALTLMSKYGFQDLSFAAALKESAAALFNVPVDLIEELKNDPTARIRVDMGGGLYHSMTWREILQRYGTEAHRDIFGQDFWVDFALKDIRPGYDYVCADCRFENEAIALKRKGGYIVKLVREGLDTGDRHASEAGLPPHLIDYVLDNNGTLGELAMRVEYAFHGHWRIEF